MRIAVTTLLEKLAQLSNGAAFGAFIAAAAESLFGEGEPAVAVVVGGVFLVVGAIFGMVAGGRSRSRGV